MPDSINQGQVAHILIKVNGSELTQDMLKNLYEAEVETSLYLPSMFTLRFYDEKVNLVDQNQFAAGGSVEILLKSSSDLTSILKGEITAVEPEFSNDFTAILVVRGYDKGHRLNRGNKTRVFVEVKDSDIVTKIAQETGLRVQADATTQVHKHVFQHAVNDWMFLHERARRNGYEMRVDDGTLYFSKLTTNRTEVDLAWGQSLQSFYPRMTVAKQVSTVKVKGWDPKTKQGILGTANSSSSQPAIGLGKWGGGLVQSAFASVEVLEVRHPVQSQAEATTMAQSILDEINAGFLEADGKAFGNTALKPGVKVNISKVGTKFSGKYVVTTARHTYNTTEGYMTDFTVQGARAQTMADLIHQGQSEERTKQLWGGIVIGIVTNNNDPENMARVKIKFPWLDDSLESNWARVSMPGAGASRGMMWMPEVNDEVLIAFEHGDFDYPYVVGAVWNGQDAMPETTANAIKNGKVEVRVMKTRLGHVIKLTDSDSAKTIEIIGADQNTNIKFDETNKKITIESKGDMAITATGNLSLEGAKVTINGKTEFEVKGAKGAVQSTGILTVKGSVVNIN